MERRLGRGLGSLLSRPELPEDPVSIELRRIRPNPFQPRKLFDAGALEQLRNSIRAHGVLQPVLVRRSREGYELISGERRWRAARLAGMPAIPAIVREGVTDEQMLELALVENVQREDLDPIEKGKGFSRLMRVLGLTQEAVAAKVGLKRSTVANHLRLLELPDEVQEAISQDLLQMGHARALLALKDAEAMLQLVGQIARRGLSVRDVERRVRSLTRPPKARSDATPVSADTPPWARELEERMRQHLGTRVSLKTSPEYKGQITVDFYNRADLDRVAAILAPKRSL